MKNASPTIFPFALCVLLSAASAMGAPPQASREYRPLAAKAVRVAVADSSLGGSVSAAKTREGWECFDRKQWVSAMDAFLSALERDRSDASAAEGLTMAVYRSGERVAAAELAEEFSNGMPWIRTMVVEMLLVDIAAEVAKGEGANLDGLVEGLPYAAGAYDRVRELVGEKTEKTEVEDPVASAPTGETLRTSLAQRPPMLVARPLGTH